MARTLRDKSSVLPLLAEIFRDLGYEGASYGQITSRTGISKGSLYHLFPGGKAQMAAELLAEIDAWFVVNIYNPLETAPPQQALSRMWAEAASYFHDGRRVCLVGVFALDATRDQFAAAIHHYFAGWVGALTICLTRAGCAPENAATLAEDAVLGIQGALVLARALNDPGLFTRSLQRLAKAMDAALATRDAH